MRRKIGNRIHFASIVASRIRRIFLRRFFSRGFLVVSLARSIGDLQFVRCGGIPMFAGPVVNTTGDTIAK